MKNSLLLFLLLSQAILPAQVVPIGNLGVGITSDGSLFRSSSNQMLLEAMGLHVPGTAFVNPGDGLRQELTRESVRTVLQLVKAKNFTPIGHLVDERCIVNAMVALLATWVGGWQWTWMATGLCCALGTVLSMMIAQNLNRQTPAA